MSPELLEEISLMAELQFSNQEIAQILEWDEDLFALEMENPAGDIYKKVMAGRLRAEAELRKVLKKLSNQGSSPAQALMIKLIKDREKKDFLNM